MKQRAVLIGEVQPFAESTRDTPRKKAEALMLASARAYSECLRYTSESQKCGRPARGGMNDHERARNDAYASMFRALADTVQAAADISGREGVWDLRPLMAESRERMEWRGRL